LSETNFKLTDEESALSILIEEIVGDTPILKTNSKAWTTLLKNQENAQKYSKLVEYSMTYDKIRLDNALEKMLEELEK